MDPRDFPNLDPELAPVVASMAAPSPYALDHLAVSRTGLAELAAAIEVDQTGVVWEDVGRCRVYRPVGDRDPREPLAGLLYLHGGGFCLGSVALEHHTTVALCRDLGVVVVAVDYRLAPEHPYPAALEDCHAGLELLASLDGVRTDRLAVHGSSAGGGLAAALALLARDRGGPALCFQSLDAPALDDRLETPSMLAGPVPSWSLAEARRSWEHYLGGRAADRYAAPARAEDLAGLPPAYVVTCELDPLRDEGLTYALRLLAAGVSVELHSFPGTFHGVQIARGTAVVERMQRELVEVLRRRLG
ncbi:alpha/beta hydrolase [Nocardioides plantarum]|uniref:Alpha/beta hydrolase n=1 Tax=Nocardioides plantarum TaxID=29299 RepID=A0ABV5KCZ2_9ACTN|nr:alpha/beta hydrolase [Nocardioides plantarum]